MLAPPLWMIICGGCAYVHKKRKDKERPRVPPPREPDPPGSFTTPDPPDSSVPPPTGGEPGGPGIVGIPGAAAGAFTVSPSPRANLGRRGRRRGRGRVRRN